MAKKKITLTFTLVGEETSAEFIDFLNAAEDVTSDASTKEINNEANDVIIDATHLVEEV